MTHFRRWSIGLVAVLFIAGIVSVLVSRGDRPQPVPPPEKPWVEVTPEADRAIRSIAESQKVEGKWWVRLAVQRGNPPEIHVTIDAVPPGIDDFETEHNGLPIVMAKEQRVYFRRSTIVLRDTGKKSWLDVSFLYQSEAERRAASEWFQAHRKAQ